MWTSAAIQVRRLGLLTRYQAHTLLTASSQPSYSVLAAVRSKCIQYCHTSPDLLCNSFLPGRLIHPKHQSVDSKEYVVSPTPSNTEHSVNGNTEADDVRDSTISLVVSNSRKMRGVIPQSSEDQLSDEASQLCSSQPPANTSQSGESQLPSESQQPQPSRLPLASLSLAAYVASSADLRRLVALGVDVSSWDRRPGVPQMVLRLDWERDIAPRLRLLNDAGVAADRLGAFVTRNPLIFKERLDDLQVRLNYLEAKRFDREQISSVICRDPFWLMFSTARIDRRLGIFMGMFGLKAQELRQLAVKCPRLITSNLQHVKDSVFTMKEEFGFERHELKRILLGKPKVLMLSRQALQDRLHFLHNEMGLSHQLIADAPNVLTYRSSRVRQRHLMLHMLKRDQYDGSRAGYVSLDSLVGSTDQQFCRDIAQVPVASYNEFLKTL